MSDVSHIVLLSQDDPRICVGRFTYGAPSFKIWNADEKIEIGQFCSIAENVTIFGGGEHRTDWITTYPLRIALGMEGALSDGHPSSKGPTIIGNDVWIGYGATILSGSQISDGAVIGAHSLVSGIVDAYSVVAGNPAKVVRMRFSPRVVEQLQALKWWDWPIEKIRKNVGKLCSDNLEWLENAD